MIDKKTLDEHNLTQSEYELIVKLIGKEPNITELGIFSLMWSEHCSYKSSKIHLKKFPVEGEHVIQGPGENAGVIRIGDGLAAVFKIESHNHPSFIEPYQGAATGVGGILRDIFTMGARPIASMDSLRFGPLSVPKNRSIMEGVVSGIAGYGNSIGVPTVAGEVYFDDSYSLNPLVNVFCLGIAREDKIFYAKAEGVGNKVLYVGSKTGRDGIHGATMASAEFDEDLERKRPNVQVGDPFKEKLLLEACLEVMDKNLIVGIQDMGAAGLTCSTAEMASNAGTGISIDLDRVPQREVGMTPYEIMLSESQERMLVVAEKEQVHSVQEIFSKWDLEAVVIGEVTGGDRLIVKAEGKTVVDIPVDPIVNLCPVYDRTTRAPEDLHASHDLEIPPPPADLNPVLLRLLASPTLADKEWVSRQYDHMVQVNTVFSPGADACLLRLKDSRGGLAVTLDGNSLYTYLDPRTGGRIAVAEACRNLACVGAKPLGVTNCLNFGNPEKPEIMWQFKEVVEGVAEACRFFGLPITGGNVSFYNETEGVPVHPTPVLGIVGAVEDIERTAGPGFRSQENPIVLLGRNLEEIGGSEYLRVHFGQKAGRPPLIDFELEKRIQDFCRESVEKGLILSAHDLAEGGLAVCAAECTLYSPEKIGFTLELEDDIRTDALLFGESQSRILLSVEDSRLDSLMELARRMQVPATVVGRTGGDRLSIHHRGVQVLDVPVEKAYTVWKNALPEMLKNS